MYETQGTSMAEGCKEPNWEEMAAKAKKDLGIIKDFKGSLLSFINVVGHRNALRKNADNSLAELLGVVTLDIIERGKQLEGYLKKLESA